jgi:DNA repair protein RadC
MRIIMIQLALYADAHQPKKPNLKPYRQKIENHKLTLAEGYYIIPELDVSMTGKGIIADKKQVITSRDCAELLRQAYGSNIDYKEYFFVMVLNRACKVNGIFKVSEGGLTGTVADPKIILELALMTRATSLILSHNHPSGSTKPSRADEDLTRKITQAASFFDIKVLDHIILSTEGYYSFADEGML